MPRPAPPPAPLTRDSMVTLARVKAELHVGSERAFELLAGLPVARPGRARLWRWGDVSDAVFGVAAPAAAPATRTWTGPRRALRS
jgi:hypothetical protein